MTVTLTTSITPNGITLTDAAGEPAGIITCAYKPGFRLRYTFVSADGQRNGPARRTLTAAEYDALADAEEAVQAARDAQADTIAAE